MSVTKECISLELAKRLRELGVKQKSVLVWSEYPHIMEQQEDGTVKCIETITEIKGTSYWRTDEINNWAAFTLRELFEIAPTFELSIGNLIFEKKDFTRSYDKKENIKYYCAYGYERSLVENYEENPANAIAKAIIYLIENNLVSDEWRDIWMVK